MSFLQVSLNILQLKKCNKAQAINSMLFEIRIITYRYQFKNWVTILLKILTIQMHHFKHSKTQYWENPMLYEISVPTCFRVPVQPLGQSNLVNWWKANWPLSDAARYAGASRAVAHVDDSAPGKKDKHKSTSQRWKCTTITLHLCILIPGKFIILKINLFYC